MTDEERLAAANQQFSLDANQMLVGVTPTLANQTALYHQAKPDRETLIQQAVKRPPPPTAFGGLKTGPDLSIEYEANVTFPVEQSNPMLRNLSPFMLQVEPPLIYGEAGGFLNQQTGQVPMGTYNAAQQQVSGYNSARQALYRSNLTYLGMDGGMGDVSSFVQQGTGQTRPKPAQSTSDVRLGPPAIADINTAIDIARQLSATINAPPLVLLVNPATLQLSYTKIQQYSDRTRFGFKFHQWGEEQVKLSITAKCGAYVSGERGVQFASRQDSASWQNLMGAFHLYRNNGYIYDTIGKSNAHHMVGALSIHYDGWTYFGHMESFSWTEDESLQHGGIEFSMEFTASQILDTSQSAYAVVPMRSPVPSLSDPRYSGQQAASNNQAGEFTVALTSIGPQLTTQGRVISGSDVYQLMQPGALVFNPSQQTADQQAGLVKGLPSQPLGDKGFVPYTVDTPGQREVLLSVPNRVTPFQRGR